MEKKKKNKKKIWMIILPIVLVALLGVSVLVNRQTGIVETIGKDIAILFQKGVMAPFISYKNDKGVTQSETYRIQKNQNESLEKEIEELKEVLELNKTLTSYEPINATILSRNKNYWLNTITIDKGSNAGIKEGMAVITKKGLVGKITKVSHNSSEVKLLTADDKNFKVSISIKTGENHNYAILNGYDSKTKTFQATGIDKTTPVNPGDVVLTSGIGSMFPEGIYIGTVEKVESDKYNLSKILSIKTDQDYNNIHYVTVLKVKE